MSEQDDEHDLVDEANDKLEEDQSKNTCLSAESYGESDDDSSGSDNLEEIDRYWPPPTNESVEIVGSNTFKTISTFCFNNAGTRFAAGSHDHGMRIWHFDALDPRRPESICATQPCGQTIIKNIDYTNDDELLLVISGSCQAVIVAKDGILAKQYQCPKGDQYMTDMAKTKGHVQMLNHGCWNPKNKENFITCSNDSTIRIWDLANLNQQKTVIKTRSPMSGLKALPNVCVFSRDALSIVAGCNDGSIMMWDTRRKFITTSACIKGAHLKGSEVTGIDFSYGLNKMCSRSEDESCKIWDMRKLKEPLASRTGLTTLYPTTNCSFSPDDKYLITGTSATKQDAGHLVFLDASHSNLEIANTIEMPSGVSVVSSKWHPKINHIGFSCSNGTILLTYDKKRSMGGLMQAESGLNERGTKRKKYVSQRGNYATSASSIKRIITPHSLPLFREDTSASSFAKIRQDPKLSYKPEVPVAGANQGGRVKPAGSTLSSYIAKNIAKPVDDGTGMDIRERILRHAEEAKKNPFWAGGCASAREPR